MSVAKMIELFNRAITPEDQDRLLFTMILVYCALCVLPLPVVCIAISILLHFTFLT